MAFKLEWDKVGEKFYETGVDRAVVYPMVGGAYPKGAAFSGLTNYTESPEGAEPSDFYADNIKYATLMSVENFKYSIEAYTYPDEFAECLGEVELADGVTISQQARKPFGFCVRTLIGNDTEGETLGYKLHLIYNSLAAVSEKTHNTINDSAELEAMSWECSTTPVNVEGHKPTAHLVIDSRKLSEAALAAVEAVLYGSGETEARLPLPTELVEIINSAA